MEMESTSGSTSNHIGKTVAKLIEKLSSAGSEERECACSTIALLTGESGGVQQLLSAHCAKKLGPLILDAVPAVRLAAVGALRNVSVDGGEAACDRMVKEDVMTHVCALLKEVSSDMVASVAVDCGTTSDLPVAVDILYQTFCLLSYICETSEPAVRICNQQSLLPLILPYLQAEKYGYILAIAAAQCLQVLTDENPEAAAKLCEPDKREFLIKVLSRPHVDSAGLLLQVISAGILCNLGAVHEESDDVMDNAIFTVLARCLQQEVFAFISKLENSLKIQNTEVGEAAISQEENDSEEMDIDSMIPQASLETDSLTDHQADSKSKQIAKMVEEMGHMLTGQRVALELLTNMCCTEADDSDQADSEYEESGDSEEHDLDDNAMVFTESQNDGSKKVEMLIQQHWIFHKIIMMLDLPDVTDLECFKDRQVTTNLLKKIPENRTRALLCISNMVNSLPPDCIGELDVLHDLWHKLGALLLDLSASPDIEKLDATSSALRAVISRLCEHKSPMLSSVTESDLKFLFQVGEDCSCDKVRANAVRTVSALGCYFSQDFERHQILKLIGQFLVKVCSTDNELWVVAEALDSIFDVFAEDETNDVAGDLQLIENLKEMMPRLKGKMRCKKLASREHLPIISTAKTNLLPFISFKEKQMLKL